MTNVLALTKLVLYRHGIGYFTREGVVEESELTLDFDTGNLDDALKSMVIQTLDGGQVLGAHFEAPANRDELLREMPLALGHRHSLFDLLQNVRGTRATVKLEDVRTVSGRIMGIELHPQGRKRGAMLVLLTGEGLVEQIATDRIAAIQLEDGRTSSDLDAYLDASRQPGERREVRIALSEPGHRIRLMYAAPAPTWRVSYRLIGATGDGDTRDCLLQAWAIFDNPTDEDLTAVDVVLVAGQPVSFRYDLATSTTPQRPLVHDPSRAAAAPVEFQAEMASTPQHASATIPAFARRSPRPAQPHGSSWEPGEVASSTLPAATGQDRAELFEYRLGKLSVGRRESALSPIAQQKSEYRRELLYNRAKYARHPVASLRLRNETGLTLERGPMTLVEDGEYRGEAMLPFAKPGEEIVLAYAIELGVRVHEASAHSQVIAGIRLDGGYLHIQEYTDQRTTYSLTNATEHAETVTIERTRWAEAELVETPAPDEQTAEYQRWRVQCATGSRTEFAVTERFRISRSEAVLDTTFEILSHYLQDKTLDRTSRSRLQEILRRRQAVHELDTREAELHASQDALLKRRNGLRQDLAITATSEQEQEIRRRSAESFRQLQDRDAEIESELAEIQGERVRIRGELEKELGALRDTV